MSGFIYVKISDSRIKDKLRDICSNLVPKDFIHEIVKENEEELLIVWNQPELTIWKRLEDGTVIISLGSEELPDWETEPKMTDVVEKTQRSRNNLSLFILTDRGRVMFVNDIAALSQVYYGISENRDWFLSSHKWLFSRMFRRNIFELHGGCYYSFGEGVEHFFDFWHLQNPETTRLVDDSHWTEYTGKAVLTMLKKSIQDLLKEDQSEDILIASGGGFGSSILAAIISGKLGKNIVSCCVGKDEETYDMHMHSKVTTFLGITEMRVELAKSVRSDDKLCKILSCLPYDIERVGHFVRLAEVMRQTRRNARTIVFGIGYHELFQSNVPICTRLEDENLKRNLIVKIFELYGFRLICPFLSNQFIKFMETIPDKVRNLNPQAYILRRRAELDGLLEAEICWRMGITYEDSLSIMWECD